MLLLGGSQKVAGQVEQVMALAGVVAKYDPVAVEQKYQLLSSQPDALPDNGGRSVSWSPDGQYVAIGRYNGTSELMCIYKRSGDAFAKLPAITTPGNSNTAYVHYSPAGGYIALASGSRSPYITMYKQLGDTITRLADPASLPTGEVWRCAFSPDGLYLAVPVNTVPASLVIYKRTGDVFTKLPGPAVLPSGGAVSAGWSPDGVYLVIGHYGSPYFTVYRRDGDTFTKLGAPAVLPTDFVRCAEFSPDGTYLALGISVGNASTFMLYRRDGDTFTKLADPSFSVTPIYIQDLAFTPDGKYLAVAFGNNSSTATVSMALFKFSGDVLAEISRPTSLPATGNMTGVEFSPDASYLCATFYDATVVVPVAFWKRIGPTARRYDVPQPYDVAFGYAKEPGTAGQQKTIVVTHP